MSYKTILTPCCIVLLFLWPLSVAMPQQASTAYTVVIGGQEWMAANLDVDKYWDGQPIPEAKTIKEWMGYNEHKTGCYCKYDNEACYGHMYGKLYNWYAIKRGVAPHCWRLPDRNDFDRLITHLGMDTAGKKLKAKHSWNNEWNGNNESGFNGLAGGCRNPNGTFSFVGRSGFWWTRDGRKTGSGSTDGGLFLTINYDDKCNYDVSEGFGYSVRCVRDVGKTYPHPCP